MSGLLKLCDDYFLSQRVRYPSKGINRDTVLSAFDARYHGLRHIRFLGNSPLRQSFCKTLFPYLRGKCDTRGFCRVSPLKISATLLKNLIKRVELQSRSLFRDFCQWDFHTVMLI